MATSPSSAGSVERPVAAAEDLTSQPDRFRVLSIDGGGIRGLIAARVIARLEELISAEAGEERRLADCFHVFAVPRPAACSHAQAA